MKRNGGKLEHVRLIRERFLNDITLVVFHIESKWFGKQQLVSREVNVCCLSTCDILEQEIEELFIVV